MPSPCDGHGEYDLLCQLRRHTIAHYGQHQLHGGLLSDPALQDALRAVIDEYRLHTGKKGFDDAYVDCVPTTRGPRAVRRFLAIPRCTNSLSLYLFFAVDALVFVAFVKIMRYIQRHHMKPPSEWVEDDEKEMQRTQFYKQAQDWSKKHWDDIPFLFAFLATLVVVTLTFFVLHRVADWIEEPHFLLTFMITMYLFAYKHLDSLLPDPM